jgi:hypothetical protein
MANYVQKAKAALIGSFQDIAADADKQAAVNGNIFSRTVEKSFGNATAGTAITESNFYEARRGGIVRSATIIAPINVAQDAANIATVLLQKRTITAGVAGAAVTIATFSTITVTGFALTAFVPFSVPLTAANVVFGANDVLTYSITKGGTGVALTAATSEISISVDIEEDGTGAGGP